MRSAFILSLGLMAALLAAVPATAGIDLEVPTKASLRGSVAAEDAKDYYHFEATGGSLLKLSVSGKGLDLTVELTDPLQKSVVLAAAPRYQDTDKKISLNKLVLEATGLYRLAVSSSTAGDYKLKFKVTAAKKAGDTFAIPAGDEIRIPFSAPAGSTVTFKAKAARKSLAEPRFGEFEGVDLAGFGKSSAKSHVVKVLDIRGGDLEAVVRNLGTTAGDVKVQIKIKAPRVRTAKLDLRSVKLGSPSDGGTALGRRVEAESGGEVMVEDDESSIAGTTVKIEPGDMPEDTTITIASAPPVKLPADRQAAGPTIEFGPAGLTFSTPVEVTVPYDPALIPSDVTAADLRVLHVKGTGGEETLTPTAVDETNHLLTVEMSSFSTVMPMAPKGASTLAGREFWFMDLFVMPDREYEISGGRGVLKFGPEGKSGSSATGRDFGLSWSHDASGEGVVDPVSANLSGPLTWNYNAAKTHIDLGDAILEVSADGKILLNGSHDEPQENWLAVGVEKSNTAPTFAEIAGTWKFVEVHFEAVTDSEFTPQPRVKMQTRHIWGTATFNKNGTLSASATEHFVHYQAHGSIWDETGTFSDSNEPYSIAGAGKGYLAGALDVGEGVYLFPSADRNIMIGLNPEADDGHGITLIVAVRQSGTPKLSGNYRFAGTYITPVFASRISDPDSQMPTYFDVNDIWSVGVRGTAGASNGKVSFAVNYRHLYTHEDNGYDIVVENGTDQSTETIGSSKGFVTIDGSKPDFIRGALTPSGNFGVFHQMKGYRETDGQEELLDTLGFFLFMK